MIVRCLHEPLAGGHRGDGSGAKGAVQHRLAIDREFRGQSTQGGLSGAGLSLLPDCAHDSKTSGDAAPGRLGVERTPRRRYKHARGRLWGQTPFRRAAIRKAQRGLKQRGLTPKASRFVSCPLVGLWITTNRDMRALMLNHADFQSSLKGPSAPKFRAYARGRSGAGCPPQIRQRPGQPPRAASRHRPD